ncbi:MAG: diguanylate cyclase [Gammaproteobacteria bacterium]|nr:diguanylate cyclase [Gammaproteobacteria bacterium]NNL51916.1 diguanylate cyclase [Woeseiaceae bacterium]
MSVTGLDHYNLRGSRELLDELCAFYCDVVGLAVGERPPFNQFGYWLYARDQAVLHLSLDDAARAGQTNTVFNHAAFRCTEFQVTKDRLDELHVDYQFMRVPGTTAVQLFIEDPAGNGVELNFESE